MEELPKPTPDAIAADVPDFSIDGQTKEFRDAIASSLNAVNLEIAALDAKPEIEAVIRALTSVLAEFIAMQPNRNSRRIHIAEIAKNLPRLVMLRAGQAQARQN